MVDQSVAVHQRQEHYDLLFKVVTVGDAGSGKTSLIHRYIYEQPLPSEQATATIGVEFASKRLAKDDGKVVKA